MADRRPGHEERVAKLREALVGPHQRLYVGISDEPGQFTVADFHAWIDNLTFMLVDLTDALADAARFRSAEHTRRVREIERG